MNSSQRRQAAREGRAERDGPLNEASIVDRDKTVRQALECGLQLHRAGDFQRAAERYYQALELHQNHEDALHLLGLISYQSGDTETATRLIHQSIAAAGCNPVPHLSLGDVMQSLGRYEEAVEAYRRGLNIDSDIFEAHNSCGIALHALEKYEDAIASFKFAIAVRPGYATALGNLGNSQRELGQFGAAMESYRHALLFHPECAIIHNNLGNALRDAGDVEAAVDSHRLAVEIEPNIPEPRFNLGNAYADLDRFEDASVQYLRAIEIAPRFADAHYNFANVRREQGRLEEAVASYHRTVSIDPEHIDAYNNLGNTLHDLGITDQARAAYRIALELDPGRANARHMVAALSGETPNRAPPEYIRELFDHHAAIYDEYVRNELDYQAPRLLRAAVELTCGANLQSFKRFLDLGCGTGLAARAFEGRFEDALGIDLSPAMIGQASASGLYSRLHIGDLVELRGDNALESGAFDLVVAADGFVHTGDLDPVFEGVARLTARDGLFAFSAERDDQEDFTLRQTGRYAHGSNYLRRTAENNGFETLSCDHSDFRNECGARVPGLIVILKLR